MIETLFMVLIGSMCAAALVLMTTVFAAITIDIFKRGF